MEIQGLYGVVATGEMKTAEAFYTGLIGRGPDDRPMDTLIQWRDLAGAGIQIVNDPAKAGSSLLTIVVPSMTEAREAIKSNGLKLGEEVKGDFGVIAQINDPDGNLVTLAEPPRGFGNKTG